MTPPLLELTPDVSITSETHTLITERTFDPDVDIWRLLATLRETRVTGTLTLSINCGGVCRVVLSSKEKVRT